MEEFSQSRGDDDLFDDEIVPIEPSPAPTVENTTQKLENISITAPTENLSIASTQQTFTQRGRGRGRGPSSRGLPRQPKGLGLADSKFAPKPPPAPTQADPIPAEESSSNLADPTQPSEDTAAPAAESVSSPPASAPTGPSAKPRPPAVRGDRSLTGGFTRPKLSENELTEKLAAARQRNQDIAAAHARAQADKESFDERERLARVRREGEERRRKELEVEREGNRRRKMQGAREWDREKIDDGGTSRWDDRARERRRDGMGDDDGEGDLRQYMWEESGRGRGRGRGGRGRGGGGRGGGGRGERGAYPNGTQRDLNVSAEQDFPAFPIGTASKTTESKEKEGQLQTKMAETRIPDTSAGVEGSSWADQVETERAEKG